MSREEKKAEEQLKALLRLPANKRCINCDSLGPQYVVSAFNVFVCTVCSGVHRQFGHRVKGVSMSTFKADEVTALKDSGNEKFAAFFLHKWTSAALPKPVEREAQRIHAWIAAVYQERRFFAEPAGWAPSGGAGTPSRSAAGSTTASEAGEPSVRPLHEVLGSDTPKLQVQHSGSLQPLERSVSAASSSAGAATPTRSATAPPPAAGATAARGLNLLDTSSPKSAKSAPPPAPPAAWDPFGASSPTAAAAPASQSPPPPAAAAPAGWASFGDAPGPQQQQQQQEAAAAAPPAAAPAAEGTSSGGWEAFGDAQPAAEAAPAAAGAKPGAAAPVAVQAAAAGLTTSASSSPGKQPPQHPKQPVRNTSRPEVPMDVFFPEFEQIRATGMLPNGQPVPLPAFPPSYAGVAPRHGTGPAAAASHPAYGHPAAATGQQRPASGYGGAGYGGAAPPRPTIAIPPAPMHPGGYYPGAPSPGAYYQAVPSPNPYSSPSVYSPGSLPSPAGSAFSAGSQPGAAPSNGGYGGAGPLSGGLPDLRSSTGSLGELMPGSAAPTPAGAAAAAHDPFAGLAPGLRAALPAAPAGGSKWGAGAPPPTPAGGPPFANGGGAPPGAFPLAGPFAGAPPPSPAGLAPATAAASATLFGRAPSLTGYDMSAPAAPKPQPSGNPFA